MSVIIDKYTDKDIINGLKGLGIKYYMSTELEFLYKPVCTHPDMQIHFVDRQTAIAAPSAYNYYKDVLPDGIILHRGYNDPGDKYPRDCAYNVARIGKRVVGNLKYVDPYIIEYYQKRNYYLINTKQGYTKCNLCIVDENSAITEDNGLYDTLRKSGIDVLYVPVGDIKMPPFEYGFIGGASGKIDEKKLCFCGDILALSYCDSVVDFVNKRNIEIISLSKNILRDYGSILWFEE